MQLLETRQIPDVPYANGQRVRRAQRKANLQHVKQSFNGANASSPAGPADNTGGPAYVKVAFYSNNH